MSRRRFSFELPSLVAKRLHLLPPLGQCLTFIIVYGLKPLRTRLIAGQLIERHSNKSRFVIRLRDILVLFKQSGQRARGSLVFVVAAIGKVTFDTVLPVKILAIIPSLPSIKRIVAIAT